MVLPSILYLHCSVGVATLKRQAKSTLQSCLSSQECLTNWIQASYQIESKASISFLLAPSLAPQILQPVSIGLTLHFTIGYYKELYTKSVCLLEVTFYTDGEYGNVLTSHCRLLDKTSVDDFLIPVEAICAHITDLQRCNKFINQLLLLIFCDNLGFRNFLKCLLNPLLWQLGQTWFYTARPVTFSTYFTLLLVWRLQTGHQLGLCWLFDQLSESFLLTVVKFRFYAPVNWAFIFVVW